LLRLTGRFINFDSNNPCLLYCIFLKVKVDVYVRYNNDCVCLVLSTPTFPEYCVQNGVGATLEHATSIIIRIFLWGYFAQSVYPFLRHSSPKPSTKCKDVVRTILTCTYNITLGQTLISSLKLKKYTYLVQRFCTHNSNMDLQ